MNNEADKPGAEAAAASTWFLSDASLLCPRSSTSWTRSSNGNTKQFEQICFAYNEIRLCDSNVHNKGKWVVCEFKSAGDDLYVAKQYLIIHISDVGHIQRKHSPEIRYHRSCYSQFTYRKREDKVVFKAKKL